MTLSSAMVPPKVQGTKEKQINEQHQESRNVAPRMEENIFINTQWIIYPF